MAPVRNLLGMMGGYIFMVGCILGAVFGVPADPLVLSPEADGVSMSTDDDLNALDLEWDDDLEPEEVETEELEELLSSLHEHLVQTEGPPNVKCRCSGLSCSCCQHIRIKKIRVKGNLCLNVQLLPRNFGILFSLTLGRRTLYRKEISVKRPRPLCFGLPFVKKAASACIEFYDINFEKRGVRACARLKVRFLFKTIFRTRLGCFGMRFLDTIQEAGALQPVQLSSETL